MKKQECIDLLKEFNEWRTSNEHNEMLPPKLITKVINTAINILENKHMKKLNKKLINQLTERIDKLEQAVFKEAVLVEEQPEAIDWNKPQLVINQYGTLIATTGENTENFFMGVLIKNPFEHKVIYTSWNKEVFKPFKDTINIE